MCSPSLCEVPEHLVLTALQVTKNSDATNEGSILPQLLAEYNGEAEAPEPAHSTPLLSSHAQTPSPSPRHAVRTPEPARPAAVDRTS